MLRPKTVEEYVEPPPPLGALRDTVIPPAAVEQESVTFGPPARTTDPGPAVVVPDVLPTIDSVLSPACTWSSAANRLVFVPLPVADPTF
jgi:hypothetical protein